MSILTKSEKETLERLSAREDLSSSEWAQRILDAAESSEEQS